MTTWVSKNDNFKGHFNLSTKGHGKCLEHMMKFGLPIILLGGGGYNILNVTRGVGHMIQDYAVTIKLKGKFQKQKFIMIFMHLTIKFM